MYIGDINKPLTSVQDKATVAFPMVLLALCIGFVIGFLVWSILSISNALIHLMWVTLPNELGNPLFFAPIVCILGGLIIGLWNHYTHVTPKALDEVMGTVKKTGSYKLQGGLGKNIIGFLLPLTFGGSIGPEAGLTGIIAGACCWMSDRLRKAGVAAKSVADLTLSASLSAIFGAPLMGIVATAEDGMPRTEKLDFRRGAKIVLYTSASFGAFAGILLVTELTGHGAGLPRFESINASIFDLLWMIPLVAVAYLMALLYFSSMHVNRTCATKISAKTRFADLVLPIVAGAILGTVAFFLPDVLFSGEKQSINIQSTWMTYTALVLILSGLAKVILTPCCLQLGWHGGMFFPVIFAGVSVGYGFSMFTGVDPMLCVAVITTGLVAAITRKPLMTLAIIILCFPVNGILWLGLAAVLGASLPIPQTLLPVPDETSPDTMEQNAA